MTKGHIDENLPSNLAVNKRPASPIEVAQETKNTKKVKALSEIETQSNSTPNEDPLLKVPAATNTQMPTDCLSIIPPKPEHSIKIVSWNVASIRASLKKGFKTYLAAEKADIVCLQETKIKSADEAKALNVVSMKDYPYQYWHSADPYHGHYGCAIFCRLKPVNVYYGFAYPDHGNLAIEGLKDDEGRVLTIELEDMFVVNSYVPNAGQKLQRLDWKTTTWITAFETFAKRLQEKKPIVWLGDLNVAEDELDLARPKENRNKTAGFTDQERKSYRDLLKSLDLVDTWRQEHPQISRYTYFSYRFQCRQKNLGWRLDYCLVQSNLADRVLENSIREQIYGASDHVPLVLTIKTL